MKIKAALKHLDADGSEGCFNLYDEDNHYIGSISVSDASDLSWSIQMQIQVAHEAATLDASINELQREADEIKGEMLK